MKSYCLDLGGWTTKAGRLYDRGDQPNAASIPSTQRRSVVGRVKRRHAAAIGADPEEVTAVGDEALADECYSTSRIVDHGHYRDKEELGIFINALIRHEAGFRGGDVDKAVNEFCDGHGIVVPISISPCKSHIETTAELLFESCSVPKILIPNNSTLAMFGLGKVSGVACQIGYGTTHIVPVVDGYPVGVAIENYALGGEELVCMLRSMSDSTNVTTAALRLFEKVLKRKCYFAPQPFVAEPVWDDSTHKAKLPDGSEVLFQKELALACEPLFDPHLVYLTETPSVPEMIKSSIYKCGLDDRAVLMQNITVTGGIANLKNCGSRFTHEMRGHLPTAIAGAKGFMVGADGGPVSWAGADIATQLPTIDPYWFDLNAYHENGPSRLAQQIL